MRPRKFSNAPFEKGAFERKRRSSSIHQLLGQLLVFGSVRLFRFYRGMKILPVVIMRFTLPQTNIATEKRPSQKEISVPIIQFQVPKCQFQGRVISPFKISSAHQKTQQMYSLILYLRTSKKCISKYSSLNRNESPI